MKDRPKLGRGLRDVSPFFLSEASLPEQQHGEIPFPAPPERTVCVCHPSSVLIQSFFTANLALELARHRHGVQVWDYAMPDEHRVTALMHSLLEGQGPEQDGHARIMLYGLPRITIRDGRAEGCFTGGGDADADPGAVDGEAGNCILVNARPHPDFILQSSPADDSIILTGTGELSLLQCYAHIKVIRGKTPGARIWIAFDGQREVRDDRSVFERLSGFAGQRLDCQVGFLGTLVHDESVERSFREEKPLVLFAGQSAAKEALSGICTRFIEGLHLPGQGEGS
ncbi:MAG: hypothetical protein MUD15_02870 [Desulfobacterota bacterium]|nr:hypothetical protein [Thermodesulfobacteriota bacterium]